MAFLALDESEFISDPTFYSFFFFLLSIHSFFCFVEKKYSSPMTIKTCYTLKDWNVERKLLEKNSCGGWILEILY
jgi:hypothetical protein